ncbi:MAG: hypothetical protein ACREMO_07225 [Gemmatimonadales bacterium]
MRRGAFQQLKAGFLAFVFLAGGFGLTGFDALAFHRHGAELATLQPHFEPAGSSCGHADRCTLRNTLAGPRVVSVTPPSERPVPVVSQRGLVIAPDANRSPDPLTFQQPRAPPVRFA